MAWRHLITRKKLDPALLCGESACMLTQTRGLKAAPKLMEVVLTVDVDKVGKVGDVVKVAKGYARNLLIPQLYALPKLEKYVNLVKKQLEAVKAAHQLEEDKVEETEESKTEEQNLKDLNTALLRLENQRVVVKRLTPRQSNNLHEPITPKDIVFEVKKQQNVQIQEINLDMSSLIDALGEYEIPIRLPAGVQIPGGLAKISLKVKVRRP